MNPETKGNPISFSTPCGFFIVVGRDKSAIRISSYWQDKPVDLNRFELSLEGANKLAAAIKELTDVGTV